MTDTIAGVKIAANRSTLGTISEFPVIGASALSLALVMVSPSMPSVTGCQDVTFLQESNTFQASTEVRFMDDSDIVRELLSFHSRLASSQTDLPPEAMRVLTGNLWDLYE